MRWTVWPSRRPSLRVGLAPDAATIRPSQGEAIEVPADPSVGGERWRGATAALARALTAEPAWRGARVDIALSHRWVRFFDVPWHDDLMLADRDRAYVECVYAGLFGEGATGGTTFAIEQGGRGQPRNVCAMDTALLAACTDALALVDARLAWLGPWLVPAIGAHRELGGKGTGEAWFAAVEAGALALAVLTARSVRQIRIHSFDGDWVSALARELRRASLRAGRPLGQPIWIASLMPLPPAGERLPETWTVLAAGRSRSGARHGHLAGILP